MGNFEPEHIEVKEGPGEEGKPHIMRDSQANDVAESESQYGMNMACSDEISLDRTIPDTRLEECKHWDYPKDLPTTSVIIVFHNEGWSVLMRTVHSVINRSPPEMLHEVLLVSNMIFFTFNNIFLFNYFNIYEIFRLMIFLIKKISGLN